MGCEKCNDHSGHKVSLEEHERRLNSHDQEFDDVKKSKVSKFLLVILLAILTSVFGVQATVLYDVNVKVTTLCALASPQPILSNNEKTSFIEP